MVQVPRGYVCLRQTQILGAVTEGLIISLCPLFLDLFQIIMLNSVSDLHGYIDKCQLTRELGGTLEYGHSQWIHHRTVSAGAVLTHDYTYTQMMNVKQQLSRNSAAALQPTDFTRGLWKEEIHYSNRENSLKVCSRSSN